MQSHLRLPPTQNEKDCVWKVKCFTIFWEEPCLLVKQGNLIYSGMKKSSMKNFLVGLTYA